MTRSHAWQFIAVLLSASVWAEVARAQEADPNAVPFAWRFGDTRQQLIEIGGGNAATEEATALGLAWLAKQHQRDGRWVFDGSNKEDPAATAMVLLRFFAAGQTHRHKGEYQRVIHAGLNYLCGFQSNDGNFQGARTMYTTGLAALALCEGYGATRDPVLKKRGQAALNFIMSAQLDDGSWGYRPGTEGGHFDPGLSTASLTGWPYGGACGE